MGVLNQVLSWLQQNINLGISPALQGRLFASLIAIIILVGLQQIFLRTFIHHIGETRSRYQWQKILGYLTSALILLIVGRIWFEGIQSLATFLGLLSAGLAVALKDPIADIVGWAFILWRRPFEVGDRIQIGDQAGDVIDQRIFQFTLMEIGNWVDAEQSTGRILHLPNGLIFTDVLANYTKGSRFIWNEIPVLVTFESDWEKAKQLLKDIANEQDQKLNQDAEASFREATRHYLIQYGTLSSTVYTSVKDSGVMLTIRYLCEPRRRRDSTQAIWEDILRTFAQQSDIDFAYPTQRFYNNMLEGKENARAAPSEREKSIQ